MNLHDVFGENFIGKLKYIMLLLSDKALLEASGFNKIIFRIHRSVVS